MCVICYKLISLRETVTCKGNSTFRVITEIRNWPMLTKQLIAGCLLPILQLNPHTCGSRNRAKRRAKKIVSPRGLGHLQLHSILQTSQESYPHETSTKCLVKYDLQNENTSLYVNVHGGGIPQGLSTTGRVTVNQ